jgi:hypothetical protein
MDWLRSEDLKEVKVGTAPWSEYNSCGVEVVSRSESSARMFVADSP